MTETLEGTVLRSTAGFFDVDTNDGVVRCRMRGRLKKRQRKTDLCVIGDRVRITRVDGTGMLEEVLPRSKVFSRRHPGRGGRHREDVLVANLDQLLSVFAFGDPPFHPRMLDRFLVIAEHNGIDAVVVANKVDQSTPEQRAQFDAYAELGYAVLYTSAVEGASVGIEALRSRLAGKLSAFAGPSGAGKSSLLNALDEELSLRVANTSDSHGKGRHTTRVATLYHLADGYVADTPGIRELGAWSLPDAELDTCFVEFRPLLGRCSFRNCRHLEEPGCAIKEAVEASEITEMRYESYLRLLLDEER